MDLYIDVRQPHSHIGYAISMLFVSIISTNPRTNPWYFHKKYWELAILKNSVFLICFASSLWKLITNYVLEWMGLNLYHYDGLQPKMSTRIINEHECKWCPTFFMVFWPPVPPNPILSDFRTCSYFMMSEFCGRLRKPALYLPGYTGIFFF